MLQMVHSLTQQCKTKAVVAVLSVANGAQFTI